MRARKPHAKLWDTHILDLNPDQVHGHICPARMLSGSRTIVYQSSGSNLNVTTLTDSQGQAIQARGNVLLVAGAGTGKTSTLVERCVRLLLEENCSLDEILMVTFTEAAAAQMRSRIRAQLLGLQATLGEDCAPGQHVQKQVALLDTAHICTLHSFCLQLLRAHFYQLGLDPAVVVLDERQTAPLIAPAFDSLFHRYYAEDTPEAISVQQLVRDLGGGSDD